MSSCIFCRRRRHIPSKDKRIPVKICGMLYFFPSLCRKVKPQFSRRKPSDLICFVREKKRRAVIDHIITAGTARPYRKLLLIPVAYTEISILPGTLPAALSHTIRRDHHRLIPVDREYRAANTELLKLSRIQLRGNRIRMDPLDRKSVV